MFNSIQHLMEYYLFLIIFLRLETFKSVNNITEVLIGITLHRRFHNVLC